MGFGEDETCPIFYHKWVSKRPLVHLLAQKFRFKNGQIRSNLAKVHQTDIYAKTPEIRGFPVFLWANRFEIRQKSTLGELGSATCSLEAVLKFFDCRFSLIFRAFLPFRFSVVLFLNHKNRCFFNQKPSDVAHRLPPQKAPLAYCTSLLHRCP